MGKQTQNIILRIMCWLGFHQWRMSPEVYMEWYCKYCPAKKEEHYYH